MCILYLSLCGLPIKAWSISGHLDALIPGKPGGHFSLNGSTYSTSILSYRPGSKNGKPDAMSRHFEKEEGDTEEPEPILPAMCIMGAAIWDIEKQVKDAHDQLPPPVHALITSCTFQIICARRCCQCQWDIRPNSCSTLGSVKNPSLLSNSPVYRLCINIVYNFRPCLVSLQPQGFTLAPSLLPVSSAQLISMCNHQQYIVSPFPSAHWQIVTCLSAVALKLVLVPCAHVMLL